MALEFDVTYGLFIKRRMEGQIIYLNLNLCV